VELSPSYRLRGKVPLVAHFIRDPNLVAVGARSLYLGVHPNLQATTYLTTAEICGQDQWNHLVGLADAAVGTSVLSFLGTRMPLPTKPLTSSATTLALTAQAMSVPLHMARAVLTLTVSQRKCDVSR
jgi:hypothetical protein